MFKHVSKNPHKVDLGEKGSFTSHPGALHDALGIVEGTKLTDSDIKRGENSNSPHVRNMARSALGFRAMKKG